MLLVTLFERTQTKCKGLISPTESVLTFNPTKTFIGQQYQKINDSVVQIGKALGLTVDEDGNLAGEADIPLVKTVQPDAPSSDCEQQKLKEAIKEALQEVVKSSTPDIVIGSEFYLANNKQVMDAVTDKWNDWLSGFLRTVGKQFQQLKVAGSSYRVSKPPSMMTRFFNRVYEDMTFCVWKCLGYFLVVCVLCFGIVGWYKYYRLVPVVKEYAIVHYVLEEKLANRKAINDIDKLLNENDVDKVYEVWKQSKQ